MDDDNIATIFAPSIFKQTGMSMADMVVTMNLQSQFLTNLLHGLHFPPWGSPDDESYNPGTHHHHHRPPPTAQRIHTTRSCTCPPGRHRRLPKKIPTRCSPYTSLLPP